MAKEFNYGESQFKKLEPNAYSRKVKFVSNLAGGDVTGETHWMELTPEQYKRVRELIISMNV